MTAGCRLPYLMVVDTPDAEDRREFNDVDCVLIEARIIAEHSRWICMEAERAGFRAAMMLHLLGDVQHPHATRYGDAPTVLRSSSSEA